MSKNVATDTRDGITSPPIPIAPSVADILSVIDETAGDESSMSRPGSLHRGVAVRTPVEARTRQRGESDR